MQTSTSPRRGKSNPQESPVELEQSRFVSWLFQSIEHPGLNRIRPNRSVLPVPRGIHMCRQGDLSCIARRHIVCVCRTRDVASTRVSIGMGHSAYPSVNPNHTRPAVRPIGNRRRRLWLGSRLGSFGHGGCSRSDQHSAWTLGKSGQRLDRHYMSVPATSWDPSTIC